MGEVQVLLGSGQGVLRWCLNTEQPRDLLPEKFVLGRVKTKEEVCSQE